MVSRIINFLAYVGYGYVCSKYNIPREPMLLGFLCMVIADLSILFHCCKPKE